MHDLGWQAALAAGDALDALRDALFAAEEDRVRLVSHDKRTGAAIAELDRALARIDVAAARAATRVDAAGEVRDAAVRDAADALMGEWDTVAAHMERMCAHLTSAKVAMVVVDVSTQCTALLDTLETALDEAQGGSPGALERGAQQAPACARMLEVLRTTDSGGDAAQAQDARWHALSKRLHTLESDMMPTTPRLAQSLSSSHGAHFHPGTAAPRRHTPRSERTRRRSSMLPRPSDTPRSPTHWMPSTPRQTSASFGTPRAATPTGAPLTPTSPGRRRFARSESRAPPMPGAHAGVYIPDSRDALDVAVARICNARRERVVRIDAREEYNRYELRGKTLACRLLAMVRQLLTAPHSQSTCCGHAQRACACRRRLARARAVARWPS